MDKKIKILGHDIAVHVTSDMNVLGGDNLGHFHTVKQVIAINEQARLSRRDELLFHEVYEYLLVFLGITFDHGNFQKFSSVLWATLKENGMLIEGWLDDDKSNNSPCLSGCTLDANIMDWETKGRDCCKNGSNKKE